MNLQQVYDGLKSGEITIIDSNHRVNPIISNIERNLTHFNNNLKSGNENEQKYAKQELEKEIKFGDYFNREHYCFDCGATLYLILIDKTTLASVPNNTYWDIAEQSGQKYDYIFKKEDVPTCSSKKYRDTGKLVSEIVVETGNLIFKNYFEAENLYETSDVGEDINCIAGRNRLMQFLAKQNVGYGQMGNMSVTIFKNDDGTEIIVGTEYGYDEKTDSEISYTHKGFSSYGNISLEVWRWQCADETILKAHDEMPKNLKETPGYEDYTDEILTKVKPGRWRIEHYYDFSDCKDGIYSRLKLIS